MVNLTAMIVADSDEDLQELEDNLAGSLQTTPGVYRADVCDFMLEVLTENAFCCPICGSSIETSAHLNGTYHAQLNMTNGLPADGTFSGEESSVYACTGDSSHDVSEVVEPLLKASCILSKEV